MVQALELESARCKIGLNSIVNFSESQLTANDASISHTNAVYDYGLEQAAIEFVVGTVSRPAR